MAGQIAEIAHDARGDFRTFDPRTARILLVEALDRILTTFPESLSAKALRSLENLGVTGRLGESVVDVDDDERHRAGAPTRRPSASRRGPSSGPPGVNASPLARMLAEQAGEEVDRAGRLAVEADLSVPGHPEVLAVGDMVSVRQPDGVGARPPGRGARRHAAGPPRGARGRRPPRRPRPEPFHYTDKGNLATIGRARAVADVKGVHLSGFLAWVTWLVVHLWYLIGFQNRLLVVIRWAVSFFTHGRGARLIAHD